MKNKGFTLVELLGVIVILGIIAVITVPIIQSTIIDNTNKAYEEQVDSFEKAAKNYVGQDIYNMTKCQTQQCNVSLKELQEAGLLPSGDIKNPKTDQNFNLSNVVKITYDGTNFDYIYDTNQDN